MNKFKKFLIGRPLSSEALKNEKYSVFWGLPILSSDAISSVAYATEEILLVLVPAIGILAYHQLTLISGAIVLLLAILTVSYRQTIQSYPCGGGAYIVASDNLGPRAGVVAGAALAIDYTLTVAVSITAGTAAVFSALPALLEHKVAVSLIVLGLVFIGNLRGIRESAKLFGIPAYAFMFAIIAMIVVGFVKIKFLGYVPPEPIFINSGAFESVSLLLLLRAFSSGCTALTGVEAVSNAVPNFREPAPQEAKKVLLLLSLVVFILFGGTSLLANLYHVVPIEGVGL